MHRSVLQIVLICGLHGASASVTCSQMETYYDNATCCTDPSGTVSALDVAPTPRVIRVCSHYSSGFFDLFGMTSMIQMIETASRGALRLEFVTNMSSFPNPWNSTYPYLHLAAEGVHCDASYHDALYTYLGGTFPDRVAYIISNVLPFGFTAPMYMAFMRLVQPIVDAMTSQAAVPHVQMPAGTAGEQFTGYVGRSVDLAAFTADPIAYLQNRSWRAGGLAGDTVQRLGARPTLMSGSDTFAALRDGTLDFAEFLNPFYDVLFIRAAGAPYPKAFLSYGFGDSAPFTSLHFPLNFWNSLTAYEQQLLRDGADLANMRAIQVNYRDYRNQTAIGQELGIQKIDFGSLVSPSSGNRTVDEVFREAWASVNADLKTESANYNQLMSLLEQFKASVRTYATFTFEALI